MYSAALRFWSSQPSACVPWTKARREVRIPPTEWQGDTGRLTPICESMISEEKRLWILNIKNNLFFEQLKLAVNSKSLSWTYPHCGFITSINCCHERHPSQLSKAWLACQKPGHGCVCFGARSLQPQWNRCSKRQLIFQPRCFRCFVSLREGMFCANQFGIDLHLEDPWQSLNIFRTLCEPFTSI